eukprot:8368393-Ditylum_brightwellii.AAC.1
MQAQGVVASSQQQQRRKNARSEPPRPSPIGTGSPINRIANSPRSPRMPLSPSALSHHTMTDDGATTSSIHADLVRVLKLIEDERHLVAYE